MKLKSIFILAAITLASVAFILDKKGLKDDKTTSKITYHCVHSLHDWYGTNKNVDCVVVYDDAANAIDKVAVSGKVADFDSDDSNRDSHGLEVLEALQYPKVTFSSTGIVANGNNLKISGNLTFHGVTKAITFDAAREDKDKQISVKGGFSILLSDYKIERPSFMLMQMDDKTEIAFTMIFNK
ncbi:MAG TPA: YceI family protein [Bacteroidia bacterium]